ncbi:hypothetical protein NLJ89_g11992 [Agrocybe chaxingu]|uniref:Uncharacterized protein n=1 Tax=Agrocybe chaxingu TaxID=84603 RepID=A0A9W8JKV9_9AGAR|nr:hypothetical protein NLJ89_g11992 [Agrocybe chaxingu]
MPPPAHVSDYRMDWDDRFDGRRPSSYYRDYSPPPPSPMQEYTPPVIPSAPLPTPAFEEQEAPLQTASDSQLWSRVSDLEQRVTNVQVDVTYIRQALPPAGGTVTAPPATSSPTSTSAQPEHASMVREPPPAAPSSTSVPNQPIDSSERARSASPSPLQPLLSHISQRRQSPVQRRHHHPLQQRLDRTPPRPRE